MKNVNHLPVILLMGFLFLQGCNFEQKDKNDTTRKDTPSPFDYNKRGVYVFSVKALNADNSLLYTDTLGLMCTNKIWRFDSVQKWISWLYLATSKSGTYTFNPAKINNTATGMISNNDELFLHPQRVDQYTILEICPFPYLHFPLFIGKKWDWDLNVGSQYSPSDTIRWTGTELFKSTYEVADKVTLEISAGKIPCYQIHATSTSKFGVSSADFYYSYQYGIVRLFYLPLDHTKIEFNFLTRFDGPEMFKAMFPRYQNDDGSLDYFLK